MPDLALDPELLDSFSRLGVALAIGLLIGVERGWKEREEPSGSRTAGLRTYALVGLLGGVVSVLAQQLGGVVLALGFLGLALVMGGFELLHARRREVSDATPIIATLLTFALGALAGLGGAATPAAAAAGVAAAIILAFKEGLHGWVEKLRFEELQAGLVLAAMTVIILPLLPTQPLDPWGAVSLRTIWLLTVLIAAVSFIGYAAIRVLGGSRGPIIAGLAGGLVSSTATVAGLARLAKDRDADSPTLAAGALAANLTMLVRVAFVAGVLRPGLVPQLAFALAPAAIVTAAAALWLARRKPGQDQGESAGVAMALANPLALRSALVFGALLAAISFCAAALEAWFGARGVFALAAVSGLADVDAITLSMTRRESAAADVAATAILIAVAVNTVAKAVIARLAGGAAISRAVALASIAAAAAGGAGYLAYARLA